MHGAQFLRFQVYPQKQRKFSSSKLKHYTVYNSITTDQNEGAKVREVQDSAWYKTHACI